MHLTYLFTNVYQLPMNTVSVIYKLEWRHKIMSWYALSKCKKLINCRTGKILKKTVNSGVIGWWIGNEFYSHNKINKTFEKCRTPVLLIGAVMPSVLFLINLITIYYESSKNK